MRVILSALSLVGAPHSSAGLQSEIDREVVAGSNANKDAVDAYHAKIKTAEENAKNMYFSDKNFQSSRFDLPSFDGDIEFIELLEEIYADSVTLSVSPDKSVSVETDALLFAESVSHKMTKFKHCRDLYDELDSITNDYQDGERGRSVASIRNAIELAIPIEKRVELNEIANTLYASFKKI
jgi:hypothetical protein